MTTETELERQVRNIERDLFIRRMSDQDLFETLRLLVILHGDHHHVDVLHEFRERFNKMQKIDASIAKQLELSIARNSRLVSVLKEVKKNMVGDCHESEVPLWSEVLDQVNAAIAGSE